MGSKVAALIAGVLAPGAAALAAAVVLDLILGDPAYRAHPVRLIGSSLTAVESLLRRMGLDGYAGGILLFVILSTAWIAAVSALTAWSALLTPPAGWVVHLFFLYSFLALGDLLRHGSAIERAVQRGDLPLARERVSRLVGRDTSAMDGAACRRAAAESLSENLTDGFTSPVFWYVIGGLPFVVLFKVVSTMDSMVGYRTPRYMHFGWCGARLDDLMNFVPARLTWLLVAAIAAVVPRCSTIKALRIGWTQHAILPGPNSGWSEAAVAGAVQRRLVGPIWLNGALVTNLWLGDAADPPLETADDYRTVNRLVVASGVTMALLACSAIAFLR
jgi:adenosylcobinamide-phosphate synthase